MSLFVAGAVLGGVAMSLGGVPVSFVVAGAVLGEIPVSLFVAGAVFGVDLVSLFVAGAALGEGLNVRLGAKGYILH